MQHGALAGFDFAVAMVSTALVRMALRGLRHEALATVKDAGRRARRPFSR
jgi:hypothetical protein